MWINNQPSINFFWKLKNLTFNSQECQISKFKWDAILCCKILKSRIVVLCITNVPLKSFHLNGRIKGFHPQILILDLHYMLPKLNLEVHEWLYVSSILLWQSSFSYSLFSMNHGFLIRIYSTKTNVPRKKVESLSLCVPPKSNFNFT